MEIIEICKNKGTTEKFTFSVSIKTNNISVKLTGYQFKKGRKIIKRWVSFGEDDTFINRDEIVIPQSVVNSAKSKILSLMEIS
jgi:hypothetical protein